MKLQVAKWGNSLAVRLSAECVRVAGLQAGDSIDAQVTSAGKITLTAAKPFDKAAFVGRLRKLHAKLPMTDPVVERMRDTARY